MDDDSMVDSIAAALQAGDAAGAESLCRVALGRDADAADVLLLLGLSLQRQGRDTEAVAPYRRLTELHPDEDIHWGNYATALKRAGDFEGALQAAEAALRLAPDNTHHLESLGLLRLRLGAPREAQAALMRAAGLAPDSASVRILAAQACVACRDHRAEELLRPWREWLPLPPELQLELADMLVQVSEPWDAVELLEDLVQRTPTDWAAQLLLAKVYERLNRLDDADAKLQWVAAMDPQAEGGRFRAEIAIQQAQLAGRRREYALARTLLEQGGPRHDADDGYWFALAKACDRTGDPLAAMQSLARAHALQVEDLRVSNPELLEVDAPLLPRVDARVTAADYRAWPVLQAPDVNQSPVFVVGFPRSGTTLLEQMLDAHPRLQSMDERPFLNMLASQLENYDIDVPADLGKLNQRDCDELRKGYVLLGCSKIKRRWDARLVDKNPLNMLWLPMIHRMFPNAKFILALRHPCDVILSCYFQDFRAAPLVAACRSLENLGRAYAAAMASWLYHVEVFRPMVLVSRYEDLVADTPAQTARIAKFLELGDAAPMLHYEQRAREKGFIRTPSYTQVIEPISARSVGHWQRYRAWFEPVLPILQPLLEHWGYDGAPTGVVAAEG